MSIAIKRLIAGGLLALAAALPLNALAGETLSRVVDFRVLKLDFLRARFSRHLIRRGRGGEAHCRWEKPVCLLLGKWQRFWNPA